MTVVCVTCPEVDRMDVLRDLGERRITPAQAATLMHWTCRQVFRLAKAFRARGTV